MESIEAIIARLKEVQAKEIYTHIENPVTKQNLEESRKHGIQIAIDMLEREISFQKIFA